MAPDAIVVMNQLGIIVLVNVQAEKLFGYHRGELTGKPAAMLTAEPFAVNSDHRTSDFFNLATSSGGLRSGTFGLRMTEVSLSCRDQT